VRRKAVVIFKASEFNGSANSLRARERIFVRDCAPSKTAQGLAGFDDHLPIILPENRDELRHEVRVAHLPHVPISSLSPLGSRDEFGLNLRRRGSELGNVGTNGCVESAPPSAIVAHRFAPSKSRTASTGSQGPAPHPNRL
jgi:hypothetical protein